jgi:hypothetical protein
MLTAMAMYGGWIANSLLLAGSFIVGGKSRTGFALIAVGEVVWLTTVCLRSPVQWDMVFICVVFGAMAALNWWRWGLMEQEQYGYDPTDDA